MSHQAIFISHGSPSIVIDDCPATRFLEELPRRLSRPDAIVVASAHYETGEPRVGKSRRPGTVHDFRGFPQALFELEYPASGAPATTARVADLLRAADFDVAEEERDLDHGIWTPLLLAWPDADIPVVPLSIQPHRGGAWHYRVGRALAPLLDENVMVIGSGAATHDLSRFRGRPVDAEPDPDAKAFHDWLIQAATENRRLEMLAWEQEAPHADANHPTPEHFMPFFVAMGAAHGLGPAEVLHDSFTYGALSMAALGWSPAA